MPEALIDPAMPAPLTHLTEDEILFRDNVRRFADEKLRPLFGGRSQVTMFDLAKIANQNLS